MGIIYTRIGAFKPAKKQAAFQPLKAATLHNPRLEAHTREQAQLPSVGVGAGVALVAKPRQYDDEVMAKREAEARAVVHTVAPICNKGGYQLITTEADLKTAGRKV